MERMTPRKPFKAGDCSQYYNQEVIVLSDKIKSDISPEIIQQKKFAVNLPGTPGQKSNYAKAVTPRHGKADPAYKPDDNA